MTRRAVIGTPTLPSHHIFSGAVDIFHGECAFHANGLVSALAPVISHIAGRIFDDAHTRGARLHGAPMRLTGRADVHGRFDIVPIDRHSNSIARFIGGMSGSAPDFV